MRRNLPLSLLLAVLALFTMACGDDADDDTGSTASDRGSEADEGDEDDDDELDLEDAPRLSLDEREVEVTEGGAVILGMDENQSVGDLWQFAEEPDGSVLELVEEDFEIEDPDTDGGGGTAYFVFEAVGDGETTFVMENCFRCNTDGESTETPPEPAEVEFRVEVTS
jgi:predicted secreted protein